MKNVLIIVGGISSTSLNQSVAATFERLAPEGIETSRFDITRLPYYSQDIEHDPPDSVEEFKEILRAADGVLFVTPEYNRSFPGVLKNAIDWASRPYGMSLWDGKAAAVTGASIGSIGTFGAQHHLRQVFAYLNMKVMGQPEFYFNASKGLNESRNPKDEATTELFESFWSAFSEWIEDQAPVRPRASEVRSGQSARA